MLCCWSGVRPTKVMQTFIAMGRHAISERAAIELFRGPNFQEVQSLLMAVSCSGGLGFLAVNLFGIPVNDGLCLFESLLMTLMLAYVLTCRIGTAPRRSFCSGDDVQTK